MSTGISRLPIQFSCYFTRSRAGENWVAEHALGYVLSGCLTVDDGTATYTFEAGDLYFARRNSLARFSKEPGTNGEFRSLSIYFEQETLRQFSLEYQYHASAAADSVGFFHLDEQSLLGQYMQSLQAYENVLSAPGADHLLNIKRKEALLLLLQTKPELQNILFDFSEPGKLDLEAFMEQNYHFNIELKRFAYLTGRSLSTFKRDFEKIFHDTPSHWLVSRRLREAYHLIKEKGKMASDIYLDLGFEDLSHFSFAFKKQYGVAPSTLTA
ncbi:AraC family transcriptional regulator [Chitinophaga horti]|uniref:AraC family transcriptional regulator n=1 Tax=Chitinophaga horti TaxID=2920382 RepID=A0ABY6J1T3_9BACT|nr:AraC family transcriptional regulator [Chitinophaga horti]UYQ93627.1 AraC family transcriptional regulator [Chitinophaga horti]